MSRHEARRAIGKARLLAGLLTGAGLVAVAVPGSAGAAQARHATASAKTPPIVVRDFRFLGFDQDVVGRGWDARPNGERDAHFSVVLATPNGARSWDGDLRLLQCQPGTKPSADPTVKCDPNPNLASTRKGPATAAVVAVYRNGKRLNVNPGNPKTWLQLPRSAKGVQLDLYVNDGPGCMHTPQTAGTPVDCVVGKRMDHRLAAGQALRVQIRAADDSYYSPWVTLPGQASAAFSPTVVLSNFVFLGRDKDVLGPSPGSGPDGKPDVHFGVEITTPSAPGYLGSVQLVPYRPAGLLAVFAGDTRLQLAPALKLLDLRWSAEPVRLDLYASDQDYGPFAPGQRWRVETRVGQVVTLSDWLTLPEE